MNWKHCSVGDRSSSVLHGAQKQPVNLCCNLIGASGVQCINVLIEFTVSVVCTVCDDSSCNVYNIVISWIMWLDTVLYAVDRYRQTTALLSVSSCKFVKFWHFENISIHPRPSVLFSSWYNVMLYHVFNWTVTITVCFGCEICCVFTARCTLVQSAVLGSHVVCLSVCLWRWWIVIT